ncbi:MAG TPA: CHRD domain-containing protein [Candidatus Solibacter sp.]|nr:CHRD domain-containing protein [Candidatus Solibacter sp.]
MIAGKLALGIALLWGSTASAGIVSYTVNLDGPTEGTPSPGTGFGTVKYDNIAHTLAVDVTFSGLTSPTTNSHIHAATAVAFTGTAGIATTTPTFAGFPSGVTSGTYNNVLDLTLSSSYNPSYVSANGGTTASAEAALTAAMAAGKAYWNIHTNAFPGGEIRGFLVAEAAVPEPATFLLAGAALLGVVMRRRR